MITYVAHSSTLENNLFDLSKSTMGYVDRDKVFPKHNPFISSHYIAVNEGDVITFGPAVLVQGWHLVTYDKQKNSLENVTIQTGICIQQSFDTNTSIMSYTVSKDVAYIRIICEIQYATEYLVTKNHKFTRENYYAIRNNRSTQVPVRADQNMTNWTVIANIEGSGHMTVGNKTFDFYPGTVVCVPPGVAYNKTSKDGFRDIYLYASRCLPSIFTDNQTLVIQDDKNSNIISLMELMLNIFYTYKNNTDLLEQLYRSMEQIIQYQLTNRLPEDDVVDQIFKILQMNFTNPAFSLEQALSSTHYSVGHVRRLFKKKAGFSPQLHLMALRVDYAKALLLDNKTKKLSLSSIGYMAGFSDHSYFCRAFKARVGHTPGQFRKLSQTE